MATPAEVSERRSNFRIRQFKEKRLFNIAANLTLNTMVSFVILLTARTARIACSDRHTYRQTHTHETTTVTLSAHARRGLISKICDTFQSFVLRHRLLTERLIKQGFWYSKLCKYFKKFVSGHNALFSKYGVSV